MGLETGSFVSDLVTTNPPSSDPRAQGDDHLRLIKVALQGSFPTSSKAWYNPSYVAKTANYTILAADMNKLISFDATSGALVPTLPSLASGDAGWSCRIVKIDSSSNAVTVTPASGTINGAVSIPMTKQYQFTEVIWSGTTWYARSDVLLNTTIAGTLDVTGVSTFTGASSLIGVATFSVTPIILSTDASSSTGPTLDLYRNSASPGAADELGSIDFNGKDSGGNKTLYSRVEGLISDPTNGSEDGAILFYTVRAGSISLASYVDDQTFFADRNAQITGAISGASVAGAMVATQAEQETGSATDKLVTPGRQHFHPSAAKFWLKSIVSGGVPQAPSASYNVTSVSQPGTARMSVTIGNDFSSAEWACFGMTQTVGGTNAEYVIMNASPAAGSAEFYSALSGTTGGNPGAWHIVGFGDL